MRHATHGVQQIGKLGPTTSTGELRHSYRKKSSPDISLFSKHSSPTPLRVIRLQQRCNLDSHRGGAYTSLFFGSFQTGISENYLRVSIAGFACSLCCMQGAFLARRRTARIDLKNTQKPPRGWNSGLRRSTVIIIMGSACRPSFKPPAATFLAASTHRICKLARPMETPLCRMCFYSHTCNGFMTVA